MFSALVCFVSISLLPTMQQPNLQESSHSMIHVYDLSFCSAISHNASGLSFAHYFVILFIRNGWHPVIRVHFLFLTFLSIMWLVWWITNRWVNETLRIISFFHLLQSVSSGNVNYDRGMSLILRWAILQALTMAMYCSHIASIQHVHIFLAS